MQAPDGLHRYFVEAARRWPDRMAVVEPGHGEVSYRELAVLAGRVRDRLRALGVRPGDRVGVYLRKSIDSVAAIYGALEAGAAYVPVDAQAPPARDAYILHDCGVRAVVVEDRFEARLRAELDALGGAMPALLSLEGAGGGGPLGRALDAADRSRPAPATDVASPVPGDLAYILYTSGSTGKPKGVMLSHENADELRRLVLRGLRAPAGRPLLLARARSTSTCRSSTSPVAEARARRSCWWPRTPARTPSASRR